MNTDHSDEGTTKPLTDSVVLPDTDTVQDSEDDFLRHASEREQINQHRVLRASLSMRLEQSPQNPSLAYPILQHRKRMPEDICVPTFTEADEIEKHTNYHISLHIAEIVPWTIHWNIQHRYKDFKALYKRFEKHIHAKGLDQILKFPATPLIHNHNHEFRELERVKLEHWLKLFYENFNPLDDAEFNSFLLYELHISQAISQAEIYQKKQKIIEEQLHQSEDVGCTVYQLGQAPPQLSMFPFGLCQENLHQWESKVL